MIVWIVCKNGNVLKVFDSKKEAVRFLLEECDLTTSVYQEYAIYERFVE